MLHLMDYQALRLDPEARRIRRSDSMRMRRPGVVRRRMGVWLVNTGARARTRGAARTADRRRLHLAGGGP